MIESLVAHAEPVAMPSPVLPVGDTQPTDEVPWQPFPIDLLPEPLASFVSQTWECLGKQADPVCVALPLLTSVAAAVGHVRRIEIRPGWIEAPVLWGAVVAESGSKKSPSTKAAIRFIQQRHNFTMAEHKRAMAEWEQLREEYVAAKRSKSRGNVETLPPKPTLIQFLVDTVTVEGLAPILECRPSVLLSKDELSGWVASFDRYAANKGADVSQFLSCYDAAAWTINRKTSAPIHIDSAAVSIYGGIQPKVLAKSFGPHVDNGLLPRFMLVEPPEGEPEWPSGEVDFVVNGSLESIFDVLIALQLEDGGLPTVLDFTTDASEIFQRKWWKPINAERRRATGAVRSMLSKAEAWAARLALVIHVCRQAGSEGTLPHRIDAESIERGIGLAHWFSREWQRCFNRFQNGGCDADEAAIAFIQRRGGTITIRDLARLGPPAYRAPGAAEAAILRLVKSGKTEWVKEPTGGRPAEAVRLK
jgi:hypothetical protein